MNVNNSQTTNNIIDRDNDDMMKLPRAIEKGDWMEVKRLLAAGVDANTKSRDDFQCIPIHVASKHGHLDIIQLLVAYGADVNAQDIDEYVVVYFLHYFAFLCRA